MKKPTNECLFCKNRFSHFRVVIPDKYDEVACDKHMKDLHNDANTKFPKIVKSFISSTGLLKRGVPFD